MTAKLHSIAGQATWTEEQLNNLADKARKLAELSDHVLIIAVKRKRTTFENRDPETDYRFGTQVRQLNVAHDASPVTLAEVIGTMQVVARDMMESSWDRD